MQTSLDCVSVAKECIVVAINGEGKIKRRLLDMGITPDSKIVIEKIAPMGDPIEIRLRGYKLTLRKDEAKYIAVEVK